MSDKKQLQEEEVDLGSLFKVIGKGISNLFHAIGRFFETIFHYLILLLIFLKNNALKLGLAIIVGVIFGLIIDYNKPKEYSSNLIVETNFESGVQLYKQIDYLSDLVKEKDTITLSKVLNSPINEVAKITNIEVSVYQSSQNLLLAYDEYLKTIDTVYTKKFKLEDFEMRQSKFNFRYHLIEVNSRLNTIFNGITSRLIDMIENDYYRNKRDIKKEELNQKKSILQKNLIQIDSLRKLYKEVAIKEAGNQSSSSTIEISQKQTKKNENDIKLFVISSELLDQIQDLNDEIASNEEIINVISDFDKIGIVDKKITDKNYFRFGILFFGLMLGWILLRQLNSYLENYKNNYL